MEEDPMAHPLAPLSNFKPTLEDYDYMELVWENGQILTRGRRSNDSTRNPRTTPLLDLYEAGFYDVPEQHTGDASAMNLGDSQVVPVDENPGSNAMPPPRSRAVLPEARDKSAKEKIELATVSELRAVSVAEDNKNAGTEVEPTTETGLPEHERDVVQNKSGVEPMTMVSPADGSRARADLMNRRNLLHPKKEAVEFTPPDAQSVAMGRSLNTVGMETEEKESTDLLWSSTELRSTSLSVSSHGSLEDPSSSLDRTTTASEGSTYLSSNSDEMSEDVEEQVPARRRKTSKRKPSEDLDDLSEREQRHELNKKLRDLRRLLPNCNKGDKASLLDEAITYMMTLQYQLQFRLISLVNAFAAPHGMLPLAHYPPVGLGFGAPPFVPPPVPGAAFPNQPGMMPIPYIPFFDPIESSSQQSVPASSTQSQWSNSTSCSDNSVHTNNPNTVDRPSAHLQMPEFSQVKSEAPKHLNGQAGK